MKIKILKNNSFYVAGTVVEVPEGRGEYLVRIHIAEPIKDENQQVTSLPEPPWTTVEDTETSTEKDEVVEKMEATEIPTEKVEIKTTTEKNENNTGNVPTAKPKSVKKKKK